MHPTFDLHLHTTYSDGLLGADELVARAKERGVATIAITDHDTVDHITPCLDAGKRHGVRVIPAAEISSALDEWDVHVLAYGFDAENPVLRRVLDDMRTARRSRLITMAMRLREFGYVVDTDAILAKTVGSVGKPALARAILADPANRATLERDDIKNFVDFFERYLVPGAPAYVERVKLETRDAISIVAAAGGIPVVAHPYFTTDRKPGAAEKLVRMAAASGARGVEVFYPTHTESDAHALLTNARELGLLITAGSDYHGPGETGFSEVGNWNDYGLSWEKEKLLTLLSSSAF